tara:strand:- start:2329 stop:3408 length:1080 start_codon:yes stop_codon:yes gene_type:complete
MISSSSQLGGGAKHMFSLGEKLKTEFEVFYAIPKNDNFSKFINSKNHINISERKMSLNDILNIIKFISSISIDIIHAHGKGAGVLARIANLFCKKILIYTFHGIHFRFHSFIKRNIYLIYENIFGRIDSHKILVSKSEKEYAKDLKVYLGRKFSIINNGVLNKKIKNYTYINKSKNCYSLKKRIEVITVCRFVEQKNIYDILKIATKMPDLNFSIIGDGELWDEINSTLLKTKTKNVNLLGLKKNIFNYLYSSDIYLSTSIYEGLPLSIIEAMSVGLPIIASNVTGNLDTVLHGISGYLYDLEDINSAIKFLNKLAKDDYHRNFIGKNAYLRQRKFFSEKDMINKYSDLYKNLLKNSEN